MTGYTRLVKAAVSLPDDLFHRAEREAARRGVTRSALYAEALAIVVAEVDPDPVTVALDRFYADRVESSDLGRAAAQSLVDDGSWTW